MSTEYGKKVGTALRAVHQMHADTSKLLQECDLKLGKKLESVFGNTATRGISGTVRNAPWMARGLYRWYKIKRIPGIVEAITVVFLDDQQRAEEPLLLVGRVKYNMDGVKSIKEVCKEWDLLNAWSKTGKDQEPNQIVVPETAFPDRIEAIKYIAVPLYQITSVADVGALMEQVRRSPPEF